MANLHPLLSDILDFWFAPDTRAAWFNATPAIDADIRTRFKATWHTGMAGTFDACRDCAASCLAQVILFDQLPRNMYRDTVQRFASGAKALTVAAHAIEQGFDEMLDGHRRIFLYMPYMHSESLTDQDRCIELLERSGAKDNLFWARHHREIIARFGRFPHRNAILGRESTAEEIAWLTSDDAFHG